MHPHYFLFLFDTYQQVLTIQLRYGGFPDALEPLNFAVGY